MPPVELMSPVNPALKPRPLPDGVFVTKLWRLHLVEGNDVRNKDERFEDRPAEPEREQVRWVSRPQLGNLKEILICSVSKWQL